MSLLIPIEAFDTFKDVKEIIFADLPDDLLTLIQDLDEREELEPMLRAIQSAAPSGPRSHSGTLLGGVGRKEEQAGI